VTDVELAEAWAVASIDPLAYVENVGSELQALRNYSYLLRLAVNEVIALRGGE
jgi:hypothetical protein